MTYEHLMIDLETLGTSPGCVITQIGLAAFNTTDESIRSTNIFVDIDSCLHVGMHITGSTLRWWLKQSDEARALMADPPNPLGILPALQDARAFITEVGPNPEHPSKPLHVWGHGAAFDVAILATAYEMCRRTPPWNFRDVRDTRTLASLLCDPGRPASVLAHSAESDAVAQAVWVRTMLNRLGDPQ